LLAAALAGCSGRRVILASPPPPDASTIVPGLALAAPALQADFVAAGDPNPTEDAAAPAPAAIAEAGLTPIAGELESLPVAGHPAAAVSLPTGATGRRPVIVVVHGTGDRPNWQCEGWRIATAGFPFVVCPTGKVDAHWSSPGDTRYTHMGGAPLLAHIDAALAALEARYPGYVDARAPLLAGFSLGANEILTLALRDPGRFPRITLVEGAWNAWTDARIVAYTKGGGLRVLYGAGQDGVCRSERRAAKRLVAAGLDVRVVFAPVGHSFEQGLVDAIRAELPWLVEGDERWDAMPP
jgi:predicted esterase